MHVSPFGIAFIKRHEGCSLSVYKDTKGFSTIGYGHLLAAAPGPEGLTWTQAQVDEQLGYDLASTAAMIMAKVLQPMSQPQFDAISSLVFNIGIGHFAASTVLTEFNRGRPMHAAKAFLMWDDRGTLTARREEERAIFLYGTVA